MGREWSFRNRWFSQNMSVRTTHGVLRPAYCVGPDGNDNEWKDFAGADDEGDGPLAIVSPVCHANAGWIAVHGSYCAGR